VRDRVIRASFTCWNSAIYRRQVRENQRASLATYFLQSATSAGRLLKIARLLGRYIPGGILPTRCARALNKLH